MTLGQSFEPLLAAAKAGEEWAWAAIYRDLAGPVRGYLVGRGALEPEDEASETFLHVARGIHGFEGDESSFRSWVFAIAHRRMIDAYRRAARRPVNVEEDATVERLSDAEPSAEQAALLRDAAEAERLLDGLSPDQREILMLRVVGGLSVRETAEVVGKSESAVKVAQHRAIGALRRRYVRD